jgi:hypothetical protein
VLSLVDAKNIIDKIADKFKDIPESETREIVNSVKSEVRSAYQNIVTLVDKKGTLSDVPNFKRNTESRYLSQASNLIAYLANKQFHFYFKYKDIIPTRPSTKKLHENIGIQVMDIRRKITNSRGHVTYKNVSFSPSFKLSELNLIYKNGVETFLDVLANKLGIDTGLSLENIYDILGFKETKDKLDSITLVELYELFKVLSIDYVNIFDLTCRTCGTRELNEDEIADIGNSEFMYTEKPNAFGTKPRKSKTLRKSRKSNKHRFHLKLKPNLFK